ncbi:MAG: DUF3048 domain-containing protein [Chloroflexi bacterium]|nr:DUF3048 domain-containing protein [Chloroflexota bacterium]
MHRRFALFFLIAVIAASCGGASAPSAATSAPAGSSVPTEAAPTIAPEITLPPPAPTVPPEAAAAATPTPLPSGQIGPEDYPPDVDPLTGLKVSDPALLSRRPLLIKISNFPGEVRPQSGMDSADMVFEHYTEGGITRFTALFWSKTPEVVGSVRSARLIDVELPAMYQALFAYSGSSDAVKDRIRNSDFFDRVFSPDWGDKCPLFCRIPRGNLSLESTEFANPKEIWDEATKRGVNDRPAIKGMVFNPEVPQGAEPGSIVRVVYSGGFARWDYDPKTGLYIRRQDGEPLNDRLTGRQLSAANVIVVYATHVVTPIIEDQASKRPGLEIQAWGSHDAYIFRDGQAYKGRWTRSSRGDMLHFWYEDETTPLALKPGNTWIEFVGVTTKQTLEGAGDEWRFEPPPNGP